MKKTSSFHLEGSTYDEIDEYVQKHDLSSRNMALEMMLTERRILIQFINSKNTDIKNEYPDSEINKSNESDLFKNSISESFNNMPD